MKTVTREELVALQDKKEDLILLDVRTVAEYKAGNIAQSINIPLHILPLKYQDDLTDKGKKIVCICRSGARSASAVQFLEEHGYSNVYNLIGGYMMYSLMR